MSAYMPVSRLCNFIISALSTPCIQHLLHVCPSSNSHSSSFYPIFKEKFFLFQIKGLRIECVVCYTDLIWSSCVLFCFINKMDLIWRFIIVNDVFLRNKDYFTAVTFLPVINQKSEGKTDLSQKSRWSTSERATDCDNLTTTLLLRFIQDNFGNLDRDNTKSRFSW